MVTENLYDESISGMKFKKKICDYKNVTDAIGDHYKVQIARPHKLSQCIVVPEKEKWEPS